MHFSFTKCSKFAVIFCDDKWLSAIRYLADIFEKICALNLSFKLKVTFLRMNERVTVFQKKTVLWGENFEMDVWKCFYNYVVLLLKRMRVIYRKSHICIYSLENSVSKFLTVKNLTNKVFQWVLNLFVKNTKM